MSTEYNGDEWVTPKDFAAWLQFDVKTVQRWCRDGTITAVRRIGHRRFIINKPLAWQELETAKQRRDEERAAAIKAQNPAPENLGQASGALPPPRLNSR